MAAAVSVNLQGFTALNSLLSQLPRRLRTRELRKGIRKAIKITQQDIKITAPIRTDIAKTYRKGTQRPPPGRLRRLVRIKPRRGKRGYLKVSLIYPTEGDGNDPKNAFYWRFIVDGTRHIAPNNYIQRAADRTFNRVIGVLLGETKQGIQRELTEQRRRAAEP